MATFSSSINGTAANKPNNNASSTTSSLSYHHLQSPLNSALNHHHHHHQQQQLLNASAASTEDHSTPVHLGHDGHTHHVYDNNSSYLNSTDLAFGLQTNQVANPFDVVVSASSATSRFNADPLVRHLFNYRPNDTNFANNYYSSMSTGPLVNAFDYPYSNINSAATTSSAIGVDASNNHHGFTSTLASQAGHSHSFVHPYASYQHSVQPMLKQNEPFSLPLQTNTSAMPPPLRQQQAQGQQLQNQQGSHSQSIYPWMRRIHHNCGKSTRMFPFEMLTINVKV